MSVRIERIPAGPLGTNGYLYQKENTTVVIDPSFDPHEILTLLKNEALTPSAILLTHCHFDHYLGIHTFREEYPEIPIYAHRDDWFLLTDEALSGAANVGRGLTFDDEPLPFEEGTFTLGDVSFQIIHVPGHTPGGVLLYDGENLFSGDNLFAGSIGRADFSYSDMDSLISSLQLKVMTLPDETIVWPGHAMRTTIGREKRMNPYL